MRQVVLDTETTGLDWERGHRVIEIGCIEILNRRKTDVNFHCYINPEREVDEAAQEVHGMSHKDLADKPLFADVAQSFLDFIGDAELIIHNAPFCRICRRICTSARFPDRPIAMRPKRSALPQTSAVRLPSSYKFVSFS